MLGHFQAYCGTKMFNEVEENVTNSDIDESEEQNFLEISVDGVIKSKPWIAKLRIGGEHVHFKIGAGADESIISYQEYKGKLLLLGTGYGENRKLLVKGRIKLPVTWKNNKAVIKCYVVETNDNLLGRPALLKLKIVEWIHDKVKIKEINEVENGNGKSFQNKIFEEYEDLFRGLGEMENYEYKIKLVENAEPYATPTSRRIPQPLLEEVKKEIDAMVKNDVIEKVESTEWCAPMVITQKKNGKVRICTDFTELNKVVVRRFV
ncbi:uncharacterized protein [Onthophagus taurus]|uniref:uncharacterized protein n=1 Tax=Onthophagus taurus TaxID=166361 RepID=UPI0039BDBE91